MDKLANRKPKISLLGGFSLVVEGSRVELGFRVKELLARIALSGPVPVERAVVASDMWPDQDSERANFYLRRLLGEIRKHPAVARLFRTSQQRGMIGLSDIECDVWTFQRLIHDPRENRLREAIELFKGPLVPSMSALWIIPYRERLTECFVGATHRLSDALRAKGEHRPAAALLKRAVEFDPVSEPLRCKLMRALAEGGDPPAALKEYERLRNYLEAELNLRPSADMVRLAASIRTVARTPRQLSGDTVQLRGFLPIPLSPLVGRDMELVELQRLISQSRLVTLVGTGGVGKTRLAISAGEALLPSTDDGVWFCDLSTISSAEHLWRGMAVALRADATSADPQESVLRILQANDSVLILDNCEHIVESSANAIRAVLSRCAGVRIIATSREPLHLPEEQIMEVEPLEPSRDAVDLFRYLANKANSSFSSGSESLADIQEICRLVDCLPLGIEIAASHTRLVELARLKELVASKPGKLKLPRGREARQRTLDSAIEWSYERLSPAEKGCLRACGLAYGSVPIEALGAILNEPREIVESRLFSLRDRSMIQLDAGRVKLLETIRQFAHARLSQEGEQDQAWLRYIYWIQSIGIASQNPWPSLALELPMIRAALDWCRASDNRADLGLVLLIASNRTWGLFGSLHEGTRQFERFQARASSAELISCAHQLIAVNERDLGNLEEAKRSLARSTEVVVPESNLLLQAHYLSVRGSLHSLEDNFDLAETDLVQADQCYRQIDVPVIRAHNLIWLAKLLDKNGEFERALSTVREARAIFQSRGFVVESATTLLVEGRTEFRRGNVRLASEVFRQSLDLYLTCDNLFQAAHAFVALGLAQLHLGEPDGAEQIKIGHDLADQIGLQRTLLYDGMRIDQ